MSATPAIKEGPGLAPIFIYAGDSFEKTFEFFEEDGTTPLDFTGWTFRAQYRPQTGELPVVDFTVVVTAAPAAVEISLTPAETQAIETPAGKWDCEGTAPSGKVTTFLAGPCLVTQDITA